MAEATEYRQRFDKDTWHYRRECSNWPTNVGGKEERDSFRIFYGYDRQRPPTGELCNQCQAKDAKARHPSNAGEED